MMLKILLIGVIAFTSYLAIAFLSPDTASKIDSSLGVEEFSQSIRGGKDDFDAVITDIPSLDELKTGAVDVRSKLSDGVHTAKETIDSVRGGAQKIEENYTEAKETYESVKDTFDTVGQTVNDITGSIQEIEGALEGKSAE